MNGERQFKSGFDSSQPGLQARIAGAGEFNYIGKGIYEVFLQPTRSIAMTGSAVTQDLEVPFAHRLVKMTWKHTNNTDVDAAGATAAILYRRCPISGLLLNIYSESASTNSSTVVNFGETWEFSACTYRYSFNTTNTDRVYPCIFVQELHS